MSHILTFYFSKEISNLIEFLQINIWMGGVGMWMEKENGKKGRKNKSSEFI